MFCQDQTAVQTKYVAARDDCRQLAQLKLDTGYREPAGGDVRGRKAQLVALFSDCMNKQGWSIPDGRPPGINPNALRPRTPNPGDQQQNQQLQAQQAEAQRTQQQLQAQQQRERQAINRKTECAFARQAASNSAISAARAKACDLECSQRLRAAPDAPRPSACPSEYDPRFKRGVDRGN